MTIICPNCSHHITEEKRPRHTPETFWYKVRKTDTCWLWDSYCDEQGYGKLSYQNHDTYAHRVAFEITYGPIPQGMVVRHTCDNPTCCNPQHLLLGTPADNVRDAMNRDRLGFMTSAQKSDIISEYATGTISQRKLAYKHNVSRGSIAHLLRGQDK